MVLPGMPAPALWDLFSISLNAPLQLVKTVSESSVQPVLVVFQIIRAALLLHLIKHIEALLWLLGLGKALDDGGVDDLCKAELNAGKCRNQRSSFRILNPK